MGLVIIGGIAVLAVIALSGGGASSIFARFNGQAIIGSYPANQGTPSPSSTTLMYAPAPTSLPGATAAAGAIQTSGALQTGLGTAATALQAVPVVGQVAGIAAKIASVLLAQHTARLKGATNENNAALTIVPTFDSFLSGLVNAYNQRQITAAMAAQTAAAFDQQIYQQLRSLVGAPGTAWSDTAGLAGKCDKTCTVGCCLYYSDLGPPLSLLRFVLGDTGGKWGGGDPRLSGRTITVPKVYPGKYSNFTRASYTFTLT